MTIAVAADDASGRSAHSPDPPARARARQMLEFLAAWRAETRMRKLPILIVGDFNGTLKGRVASFLMSQGFTSSYSTTGEDDFVTHLNHNGREVGGARSARRHARRPAVTATGASVR